MRSCCLPLQVSVGSRAGLGLVADQPALADLRAATEDLRAATGKAVALCPAGGRPVTAAGLGKARLRRGFRLDEQHTPTSTARSHLRRLRLSSSRPSSQGEYFAPCHSVACQSRQGPHADKGRRPPLPRRYRRDAPRGPVPRDRPWPAFARRLMLPISLSYDHRVIDGALAARFARHLRHLLEDVRRLLL